MSGDSTFVLQEAHTIVAEQLARMRALVDRTRKEGEQLSGALRYAERQLDETTLRLRASSERRGRDLAALKQQHATLRAQVESLSQEVKANQHALKQLELFVRQIDMSRDALSSNAEDATSTDPWVLALRAQVIHGREEERARLAREVHDGPAQVLANALMILETAYGAAQNQQSDRLLLMMDRMRSAIKDGLSDARRFIADLRPARLEEQGLDRAIEDLVRRYRDTYGMHVSLETDAFPKLSHEADIVLYRIVQESLQNAYKYARNAPVVVRLHQQGIVLRLSIRDEGPGFDNREVARRAGRTNWGLTSMRERADLIGAQFTVSSRPGHGTEVVVVLPLR